MGSSARVIPQVSGSVNIYIYIYIYIFIFKMNTAYGGLYGSVEPKSMIALPWNSLYLMTHLVMAETTINPSKLKPEAIVCRYDQG